MLFKVLPYYPDKNPRFASRSIPDEILGSVVASIPDKILG